MKPTTKLWFTAQETAKLSGLSLKLIRKMCEDGKLECMITGKAKKLISRRALSEVLGVEDFTLTKTKTA